MKIKIQKSYGEINLFRLFFVAIVMIFLGHLENRIGNTFVLVIPFIIGIVYSCITNESEIIYLAIVLLTDNRILTFQGVSIQLVLFVIYIWRAVDFHNMDRKMFCYSAMLTLYCLIYLPEGGINNALQGIKTVTIVCAMTRFFSEQRNFTVDAYFNILSCGIVGLLLSFLMAIMMDPTVARETIRLTLSEESNANLLGMLAAFYCTNLIVLYFNTSINKLLLMSYQILMIGVCIYTNSRTSWVMLVVAFIMVMFPKKISSQYFQKIAGVIGGIILIILLIWLIPSVHSHFISLIQRIINPRQGDISNGRIYLWKTYFNELVHNMKITLLGTGNAKLNYIRGQGNRIQVAHNMWIEQIVTFGIIGMTFVFGLYSSSIKRIGYEMNHVKKTICVSLYAPIISLVVAGMVSHVFTNIYVSTQLFMAVSLFYILDNERTL